jgi:hypothetical protein
VLPAGRGFTLAAGSSLHLLTPRKTPKNRAQSHEGTMAYLGSGFAVNYGAIIMGEMEDDTINSRRLRA